MGAQSLIAAIRRQASPFTYRHVTAGTYNESTGKVSTPPTTSDETVPMVEVQDRDDRNRDGGTVLGDAIHYRIPAPDIASAPTSRDIIVYADGTERRVVKALRPRDYMGTLISYDIFVEG